MIQEYAKAITAAVVAFLGSIATVLVDDASLGDLTDGQWVTAVIALLVGLGAVWAIPNKPST